MDAEKLRSILTTFADPGTPVDISKGNLLVQINERILLGKTRLQDGDVYISDDTGEEMSANKWIILRVARLPLLAERILQFIPSTPYFINPEASLFDTLDEEKIAENEPVANACDCARQLLARRFGYTSSVVYLTSDAGEGKTTLIHELARDQATAYKTRRSDWLLVPIALGGRPFMRFDDMIAGHLTNKLRFPLFYYDAFIELVKLGVIIPAFDGFEETLVVNASGDAYSAIGALMASLSEQGTVLISARKAFFEYQELKLQARLYDSIGNNSVAFSRIQLKRWTRAQFVDYAFRRGHPTPDALFDGVAKALHNSEHALLTRAVLASRLLTVATNEENLAGLLQKLGTSPDNYFPTFVDAIIEREASEKWLDSSGEAAQPLLSVTEHRALLSMVAQEMWLQSTETLKSDILELIASLFCEAQRKPGAVAYQVQQRVKQHALLIPVDTVRDQFGFDHEEFRHYFLGLAVSKLIAGKDPLHDSDLSAILRKGSLPIQALSSIQSTLKSAPPLTMRQIVGTLCELATFDSPSSFLHENCAHILLRLISHQELGSVELSAFTFGPEALEGVAFTDVRFSRCTFRSTSMAFSSFKRCRFVECVFDRLDLNAMPTPIVQDSCFDDTSFNAIVFLGHETAVYDPNAFPIALRACGFAVAESRLPIGNVSPADFVEDEEFAAVQKLLKCFSNRTHITDALVRTKFGKQAGPVMDRLVPKLVQAHVLYEDTYRGGGRQRLFKLNIGMLLLQEVIERSRGSSERFYELLEQARESSV